MLRDPTILLSAWLGCLLSAVISAQAQIRNPESEIRIKRVSFLNDVEPILTRAGCNSGPCHGSQFGKGGFKLSLAAYDPDLDHQSIAKLSGGRRINLIDPDRSLLLAKPALRMAHKGGLRLEPGSADYRTLKRWIGQGAPGPDPHDPHVIALTVTPARKSVSPGASFVVKVAARFSDGSCRDVTAHTRINSLDESIARATPEGVVTAAGRGATAIMLRYGGQAAVAEVMVPYRWGANVRRSDRSVGSGGSDRSGGSHGVRVKVDRLVAAKWRAMGLAPSQPCTDHEFLRRASLDITGTLPTSDEVRRFAADRHPEKRLRLVESLLERPEYADYWTVKWGDLLRTSRAKLGARPAAALTEWLRASFARNEPYDRMVRQLLTGQGSAISVAPANYYRVATTPDDLTETTSQLFLGVRLQCARCHHHPFEKWSQSDYFRFAAFFARTGQRAGTGNDAWVSVKVAGEVTHPKNGAKMEAAPLPMEGTPAFRPAEADRRVALADWMTDRRNLAFARTLVNRYWAYFLGRGIVEPVDDVRVTNPPSNPELLDALASEFIATKYDIKRLIRSICATQAYQLSATPTADNRSDRQFYSHFLPRRLPAEVLLDAIGSATGAPEKFDGYPVGTRAIALHDAGVSSMFLDTFGRPPRSSACECERVSAPSLPQSLQLLNGESVNKKVGAKGGRAVALSASSRGLGTIVDELYLSTLSRPPSGAERSAALVAFRSRPALQAAEDLLWALINTREFAYIR